MISQFRHIRRRRAVLREALDVDRAFEQWKETCVPSYCHPNPAAAYVSWLRLFAAAELAQGRMKEGYSVLDFGASVGELYHVLEIAPEYHFIEQDEAAAAILRSQIAGAVRQTLDDVVKNYYDVVFAIDALEHNDNYAELLRDLSGLVAPKGVLILSGPTENALYRLGRRIAGFQADYHVTTIYEIEAAAERHLERLQLKTVPFGLPLFRLSAWRRS